MPNGGRHDRQLPAGAARLARATAAAASLAGSASADTFARYDADHDGVLAGAELSEIQTQATR